MKYIKLALLTVLAMTLAGCWDDGYHDGGGNGGAGGYDTYWGIIEAISVEGDVTNMTQKPESPAPAGDQEECPGMMIITVLFACLYSTNLLLTNYTKCGKIDLRLSPVHPLF